MGSQEAAKTSPRAVAGRRGRLWPMLLPAGFAGGFALVACAPFEAPPPAPPMAAASAAPAPAMPPRPAPVSLPDSLLGLRPAEILALFGRPDFRRSEPPAELWQYRSADCVLDIFLYGDAGGVRVVHSESRERGPAVAEAAQRCGSAAMGFRARNRESRL